MINQDTIAESAPLASLQFYRWFTILAGAVIMSVFWKARLTPEPEGVDLTIAAMIILLGWILINLRACLSIFIYRTKRRIVTWPFWLMVTLCVFPVLHFLIVGGDAYKLLRFMALPMTLMLAGYYFIPFNHVRTLLLTLLFSFLPLAFLALLEAGVSTNFWRHSSVLGAIGLGQASGFSILLCLLWVSCRDRVALIVPTITGLAIVAVMAGSKAEWISVVIFSCWFVWAKFHPSMKIVHPRKALLVFGVLLATVWLSISTPLILVLSSVAGLLSNQAMEQNRNRVAGPHSKLVKEQTAGESKIDFAEEKEKWSANNNQDSGTHSSKRLKDILSGDFSSGSNSKRVAAWKLTFDTFLSNPLGVRMGGMAKYFTEFRTVADEAVLQGINYPHNIILEALAELGFVGGAILILAFCAALYTFIEQKIMWEAEDLGWVLAPVYCFWLFQPLVTLNLLGHLTLFILSGIGIGLLSDRLAFKKLEI